MICSMERSERTNQFVSENHIELSGGTCSSSLRILARMIARRLLASRRSLIVGNDIKDYTPSSKLTNENVLRP